MISIVWNIGILDIGCGIWKMEYGMWVVSGCSMLFVCCRYEKCYAYYVGSLLPVVRWMAFCALTCFNKLLLPTFTYVARKK